jgi:hypothetical protein
MSVTKLQILNRFFVPCSITYGNIVNMAEYVRLEELKAIAKQAKKTNSPKHYFSVHLQLAYTLAKQNNAKRVPIWY